jgi:hypothetical protein
MSSEVSELKEYKVYIDFGNSIYPKIFYEVFKCIDRGDYNTASEWIFILRTILHQVHYDVLLDRIMECYGSQILETLIKTYESKQIRPENINDVVKARLANIINNCNPGWINLNDLVGGVNED